MLKDMPPLSERLPKLSALVGRPLWRIPSPEQERKQDVQVEDWDSEHMYGALKTYGLSLLPKLRGLGIERGVSNRPAGLWKMVGKTMETKPTSQLRLNQSTL